MFSRNVKGQQLDNALGWKKIQCTKLLGDHTVNDIKFQKQYVKRLRYTIFSQYYDHRYNQGGL